MLPRNPNLAEARKKALQSPNIGKRGPNKATIERALDVIFEGKRTVGFKRKAIQNHDEIVDIHLKQSKNPKETKDRELYLKNTIYRDTKGEDESSKHLHLHFHQELTSEQRKLVEEYEAKLKAIKVETKPIDE